MKKSILHIITLVLMFVSTSAFADRDKKKDDELRIAMDLSGDKLHISQVRLKKNKNRLVNLRIILKNKRKRKEISDEDYKIKIEIIEECEHECIAIDNDIVKLTAVIKIKSVDLPNENITIKVDDSDHDKKHKHHNYDEDDNDHEDNHHKHKHKQKHKHKHKDNCPACRNEQESTTYEIRIK